jgi:hypothetical protein
MLRTKLNDDKASISAAMLCIDDVQTGLEL